VVQRLVGDLGWLAGPWYPLDRKREDLGMSERTTAFSIELPVDVKERLDRLAETTGRTATNLATEAIRSFVELQEWQVQEIKSGLREADAGEFATDEEVAAVFAR
jgi:RHH-type rel operon transcriptional repressor/antitoxin RelB